MDKCKNIVWDPLNDHSTPLFDKYNFTSQIILILILILTFIIIYLIYDVTYVHFRTKEYVPWLSRRFFKENE